MENKLIRVYFSFKNDHIPPLLFCATEEHYQAILWELNNHCCNYKTEEIFGVFFITFKEYADEFVMSLRSSIYKPDTSSIRNLLERYRSQNQFAPCED